MIHFIKPEVQFQGKIQLNSRFFEFWLFTKNQVQFRVVQVQLYKILLKFVE